MKALLDYLLDLCLLRATPQQLPAYPVLLWLALGAGLVCGVLLLAVAGRAFPAAFLEGGVDLILMLMALFVSLQATRRATRFSQTATALLASGALFSLVAIALLLGRGAGEPSSELEGVLLLALIGWNMVVYGHILRCAFDLRLGSGIGIAVLYSLFSYLVMTQLFPVA